MLVAGVAADVADARPSFSYHLIPKPGVIMCDVDSSMDIVSDNPEGVNNSTDHELPSHHFQGSTADYTEDQDRQMGNAVAKRLEDHGFGPWRQGPSIVELSIVLQSVARSDGGLNRKYRDYDLAKELLKSDEFLQFKVADAWKTGSYRDLRKLGMHVNYL